MKTSKLNFNIMLLLLIGTVVTSNTTGNIESQNIIPSQFNPHAPILIDGDDNLSNQAASEGWDLGGTQDGSREFPYYITGYDISGYPGTAITIKNTILHLRVENNNINSSGVTTMGIYLENVNNTRIRGNSVYTTVDLGVGIELHNSYYNYIWYNVIDGKSVWWTEGIRLFNSDYNLISLNSIIDVSNGIFLANSVDNIIRNNDIYSTDNIALYIGTGSEYNSITENYIHDVWSGIRVSGSRNFVNNNEVFNCGNDAIFLFDGASFNKIRNNTIDSNSDGIYLYGENNNQNIIYANSVSNTANHGIKIQFNSNENLVSWNNFANNNGLAIQGFDNGSANVIVNNFWNDWTGPDVSPIDNIVDNGYLLSGLSNTIDNLPLVYPYTVNGLHFLYPTRLEVIQGEITVSWNPIFDNYGNEFTYRLLYSPDGGFKTIQLAIGLTTSSYLWDSTLYPNSVRGKMLVIATLGNGLSASSFSDSIFYVDNSKLSPPIIIAPTTGETVSGKFQISWETSIGPIGNTVKYDIFYGKVKYEWDVLVRGLTQTQYQWDTTNHPNGKYFLMVVAWVNDQLTQEYVGNEFYIDNIDIISSKSEESSSSPSLPLPFPVLNWILFSLVSLTLLRKKGISKK